MRKRNRGRIRVALFTILAMFIMSIAAPGIVRAKEIPGNMTLIASFTKGGDTKTINIFINDKEYYETEEGIRSKNDLWAECEGCYYILSLSAIECGFDIYGTLWLIDTDNCAFGWNYYFEYDHYADNIQPTRLHLSYNESEYVNDAESLVYDGNNQYVVGYKTKTTDIYPIPAYEEFIEMLYGEREDEEPTDVPQTPLPKPENTPTPKPTVTLKPSSPATVTPLPGIGTSVGNDKPAVTTSNKVSIMKSGSNKFLYEGDKFISKYKLKSGTLSWETAKKRGKVKKVKAAGYIKKSKSIVYITKTGEAGVISTKGKRKVLMKKGAKKLVIKSGFATKIKKKSGGSMSIVNK